MKRLIALTAFFALVSAPFSVQADEGYDKALQAYSCVDYQKAINLFKINAEKGHGLSQYMMGIMLEQGQGSEINVTKAFDWYMAAAKQGIPDAYFALADMYSKGIGVARDLVQAYAWFDLAKAGGHSLAPDMLRALAEQMPAEMIEQAKAFEKSWNDNLAKR